MIPMACSLLAVAALSCAASAQTDYRPAPAGMYNVNVSPWPGPGRTSATQPIMGGAGASSSDGIQQAGAWQSAPPAKIAPNPKDLRPGQRAAGLAKPKAQENKAKSPSDKYDQGKSDMPGKPDVATAIVPTPEQMFQLQSEKDLQARIRKDPKHSNLEFPAFPAMPPTARPPLAPCGILVEPNFVDYRRLLFEDKNSERYGWNLGPIQPLVSAGRFWGDMVALPYKVFSWPCLRYDSSAGLCLPGDPVPYFLYPPGLSLTGTAAEAGIIVALNYIFLIY
jgi:hypothetical protein